MTRNETRNDIPVERPFYEAPKIDTKTDCRDEQTCVTLNDFLDNGYNKPEWFGFGINHMSHETIITIGTMGMGNREKQELVLRVMEFISREVEKVKNGY